MVCVIYQDCQIAWCRPLKIIWSAGIFAKDGVYTQSI